jgi:diguanylate cyclase (GGDEF)-like protein
MSPDFLKRSDNDFLQRSLAGILAYMLIWPLLAWFSGFYVQAPRFNNTFNTVFVLIGVARLLHAYGHIHLYDKHPKLCRTLMLGFCLAHALTLGALLVFITLIPKYQHMIMMGVMLGVGISSGAAASLSIKPIFSKVYISVILCPAAIACLFTEDLKYFMMIYTILCVYFFMLSKRFYNEYIQAFQIEKELKSKQMLLEKLTITDTLTGVYNRQYFDNTLDIQWSLASRSQAYLSILFLDLDFFKKVNDVYGHVVGDSALCHSANIFKEESKRKSDMVARYGGEEFAIILPSTHYQDAYKLAERVRERIEKTPLVYGDNSINITVSIGVNTTIPNNKSNCTEFLDNADQALYLAKSQGRNRVVGYDQDPENLSNKTDN